MAVVMRSRRGALVAGAVLFGALGAGATSASADITVGDAVVPTTAATYSSPVAFGNVTSQSISGTFPAAGTVTTFSTRAFGGAGVQAQANVLRRAGTTGPYTVIAKSNLVGLPSSAQLTSGAFPAGTAVLAGDLLSIDFPNVSGARFIVPNAFRGGGNLFDQFGPGGFGAVGSTTPTPTRFDGPVVSVEAQVSGTPTTTCTLTAIRRASPTNGPKDKADVTVTATGGLTTIDNVVVSNGSVTVPTFIAPTTNPVIVTTSKATQGTTTSFSFDAHDKQGTTKHCA
jgi:hypothetical protein